MVENDIRPAGFAVVGAPRPSRADYHQYAGRPRIVRSDDGATAESKRQPPPKPKQAPPKQAPPKPKPSPSGSKPASSAGARSGSSQ
jgi:hypothetical protein